MQLLGKYDTTLNVPSHTKKALAMPSKTALDGGCDDGSFWQYVRQIKHPPEEIWHAGRSHARRHPGTARNDSGMAGLDCPGAMTITSEGDDIARSSPPDKLCPWTMPRFKGTTQPHKRFFDPTKIRISLTGNFPEPFKKDLKGF